VSGVTLVLYQQTSFYCHSRLQSYFNFGVEIFKNIKFKIKLTYSNSVLKLAIIKISIMRLLKCICLNYGIAVS